MDNTAEPVTERSGRRHRDLTEGSIVRNLIRLSWPLIISSSLNFIGPTIDMIWVGKLGPTAIAAVGASGMIIMFITFSMQGLNIGLRALVARCIGAGDTGGAIHAVNQAFFIAGAVAVTIMALGSALMHSILTVMGISPEVIITSLPYLRIMFPVMAILLFRLVLETTMQASGDSINPMRIALFIRSFHVIICPFLVLGLWIFPKFGVKGAAMASGITESLGLAISLWVLFTGKTRIKLTLERFNPDLNTIWRIIKVGIPASVISSQRIFGQIVLLILIAPFGTLAVAAHTIWQRVESAMIPLVLGWGSASGIIAGQNLGAGKQENAARVGWTALGFGQFIIFTAGVVLLITPETVVRIFNTDPELVELTNSFLRIAAVSYLIGLSMVCVIREFLAGIGDTIPAMLFEVMNMWVVTLPLALILLRYTGLDIYGIRWAISIGTMVNGYAILAYFWMGRWKLKKL